uniref:RING-type domain-containing protein n=1 Tax=Lotharella oceanica TaxID=641309 RepID=A0A7S2XD63_9EUKA
MSLSTGKIGPAEHLSGKWSGWSRPNSNPQKQTLWQDLNIKFVPGSQGTLSLNGEGFSLWSGERIRFVMTGSVDLASKRIILTKKHTGKFTSVVKYEGEVDLIAMTIQGTYSRGKFELKHTYHITRSLSMSPQSSTAPLTTQTKTMSSSIISLNGMWSGFSTKKNERTDWKECAISFELSRTNTAFVRGTGVSIWKGKRIPFRLEGTFDGKSGSGSILKTHIGQYRNSIAYAITVNPKQQTIRGTNQNSEFVLEKLSGSADTSKSGETNGEASSKKTDPLLSVAQLSIAQSKSPQYLGGSTTAPSTTGSGNYQRYSSASQLASTTNTGNYASTYYEDCYQSESSTSGLSSGTRLAMPSSNSKEGKFSDTTNAVAIQYKAFLQGLMLTKKLSTEQLQALSDFRRKHNIDTELHRATLKEIGITEEVFDKMKQAEDDIDDKQLCKICYEREMDCALLPCGHMVCMQCSSRISRCPHCRERFTRTQKLFRS